MLKLNNYHLIEVYIWKMFHLKVITLNFKLCRVGLFCYNGYYLLLYSVFSFFRIKPSSFSKKKKKNKAKLVWKQRCKFKASFFSFFFSGTFSHFCGKLYQYSQFGQIVTYTIYNFLKIQSWCNSYEVWVRFRIRVPVWIQVRDSVIFEKIGCGCGGVRQLKHY